jgi:tetratricopeptide (TPR) repeat protein
LLEAIENDENYVPAHIDLGFYYYAVEDDSEKALGYFEQAINKSASHLREAIIGKAKALADLDRHQEALACLNGNVIADADFGLIREELSEQDSSGH